MQTHNFHTTIAYIPKYFDNEQNTSVIDLFRNYPEKYSIVQHGNNHDGYEFICFNEEQFDSLNALYNNSWVNQKPRPYKEQENDIVEGLTRMHELQKNTGINFGKIMIFPWGISLSPTLEILKMYNYNATVNGQYQPRLFYEGDNSDNYDFNMYPASMNFRNFPVILRKHPCSSYEPINYRTDFWKYDLFLDKPLLMYSHQQEIFKKGIDKFSPVADSINHLFPDIEWKSLDYILKKMYLEKLNHDGSADVMIYGNNVLISNETDTGRIYHIRKLENMNVPILNVTVDGSPNAYWLDDSLLCFDINISANTEKEIKINYSSGSKDFALNINSIRFDTIDNIMNISIRNLGTDSGACPIAIYNITPSEFNYNLLFLSTAYISAGDSNFIQFTINDTIKNLHIILDPCNIIYETNEKNNEIYYDFVPADFGFNILSNIVAGKAEFSLDLPQTSKISFKIYNAMGRRVYLLNDVMKAGYKKIHWENSKAPSGIYFANLRTDKYVNTIKFVKIK